MVLKNAIKNVGKESGLRKAQHFLSGSDNPTGLNLYDVALAMSIIYKKPFSDIYKLLRDVESDAYFSITGVIDETI